MNDDLAKTLRDFVNSEGDLATSTAPEPSSEASALAHRVSRRRAVRLGASALSAAAVIVALAVGVHSVQRPDPGPPARPAPPAPALPSPSPTGSSTTAALPSPAATDLPIVTTEPLLPHAEPMTPGMLEAADSTWRLFRYESWAEIDSAAAPAAVYLLSPDGRTYEVPTPSDPAAWYLLDWLPGSSMAIIQMKQPSPARVIDLVSGTTVLDLDAGPAWDTRFVRDGTHDLIYSTGGGIYSTGGEQSVLRRITAEGQVRATTAPFPAHYGSERWLLSPSGATVLVNDAEGPHAITSADFAAMSMGAPYPARPEACRAWRWVTETEVLVECATAGAHAFQLGEPSELWLTTAGGGQPRQLSGLPEATRLGGLWQVGSRLVAGSFGPGEAESSWWDVGSSETTLLSDGGTPGLTVVDVVGSELIGVARTRQADGDRSVTSLVAIDPVRGTTRTLVDTAPSAGSNFSLVPRSSGPPPQTGIGD